MTTDTFDRARRLICAATGQEYGDGEIVADIGIGIAEPGYGTDETVWVMGNWNVKRYRREGEPELTNAESLPERLSEALERRCEGIELLWLDEWTRCDECQRVFRDQPDSYSWQMYGTFTEYGTYCADHIDFDSVAEDYINNPRNAIRSRWKIDLVAEGFTKLPNPEDTYRGQYESGWHPGQDADPEEIFDRLSDEWSEIVFVIDSVGQFDAAFSVWGRGKTEETEETEETQDN